MVSESGIKPKDLIGAKVVSVDEGVRVSLDKIFLMLTDNRVVSVSPLYEEGLFIMEEVLDYV
jgi:hypothetical protein